jgi:hypothetical protein
MWWLFFPALAAISSDLELAHDRERFRRQRLDVAYRYRVDVSRGRVPHVHEDIQ